MLGGGYIRGLVTGGILGAMAGLYLAAKSSSGNSNIDNTYDENFQGVRGQDETISNYRYR
ncbi:hypothetical protein [Natranaerobius thermophilus]|uniref:Uncharacterized protein n=1 Tax=Natranaerobius thermophilus (strain ATCC BAA-1301 / DSM 18059 / JW/NM-WN-LF) TaxID=457570 RepID=B2A5J9_NATTJ|nr:hypothetical protein [Natranaerobius thermophilus]ACB85354.1 hypothetical protein Nther_1782 [Natranaerobius thermophilus JW/NM-WN-LF]